MSEKCPGQTNEVIRVGLYKCPMCKYQVEIFSDELKVRCPKCGEMIYKEKLPSCVDWCASAKKCIGSAKWEEMEKSKAKIKSSIKKSKS